MQTSRLALAEPLLLEVIPCSARCGRKILILLTVLIGSGFAVLLSLLPSKALQHDIVEVQKPSITMVDGRLGFGSRLARPPVGQLHSTAFQPTPWLSQVKRAEQLKARFNFFKRSESSDAEDTSKKKWKDEMYEEQLRILRDRRSGKAAKDLAETRARREEAKKNWKPPPKKKFSELRTPWDEAAGEYVDQGWVDEEAEKKGGFMGNLRKSLFGPKL
eukprot:gnl/MRDRNA2_/MRDRNA2_35224_c0_seq1.p1 gnl/MRDRNA2_/MRDRNA2_35224_c0~~gnl/MRDRNA2_/MRDRNA2_35224_c0_seq1.p1  ORF type:complete len:217 (+),score=50.72 gnl/MRDRNA2_/MRDRNA2_35224_c0_seq1:77-727(+)